MRMGWKTRGTGRIVLGLAVAAGIAAGAGLPSAAEAEEIVVRISRVKALGKIDEASQADFYAQVIISGEQFKTDQVKDRDDIRPNWLFTKKVAPGQHDVKITILDKDVTRDDPIDINRIANKRDIDFTVDTRNCRIGGFAQPYKCGTAIIRAGSEKKRAEITFSVDVKR